MDYLSACPVKMEGLSVELEGIIVRVRLVGLLEILDVLVGLELELRPQFHLLFC